MGNRPLVLPYTRSLDVGVNEMLQRFSFNRGSKRLLENDLALAGLFERYLTEMNVFEYGAKSVYGQNDLVWVKRSKGDFKLFIVRCVIDKNSSDLQKIVDAAYVEGADEQPEPAFDENGWKDENKYLDLDDYDVQARLRRYFAIRFARHERDDVYHRFGALGAGGELAVEKIMLADMSNAKKDREIVFYPYYTRAIDPDDSILYGFYRVWDSGELEVDVVYRLGYRGQAQSDGYVSDILQCNDYSMRDIRYSNSDTSRYFNTTKDRDIFAPLSSGQSVIDDIIQLNRNDYVNTYSADIKFPKFKFGGKSVQFRDSQYMIFGSDVMSQDANTISAQIEPGANCMAYCNKTRQGFTALYITYPDKGRFDDSSFNAQHGGLVSNSFHCHIIGRWMEEPVQI